MKIRLCVLAFIIILFSCKKENEIKPAELPESHTEGVLIGNEGNFNWSNASLSFYDKSQNKVYNGVFKDANNKPLGDVLQSIYVDSNKAYLVINNSGKIVEVNLNNFKEIKEYIGFTSPRYLVKSGNYAFVSDLYANAVYVVDLTQSGNNAIIKTIRVNGWTEQMVIYHNNLYVAGVNSNNVYVINIATKTLIDSIPTADAPMSLTFDKDNYLWAYCGDYQSENYVLEKIDIYTKEPIAYLSLPANNGQYATKMAINYSRDKIWLLYNGVKTISVEDSTLQDFIAQSNFQTPYGIGVDKDDNVYIADAKDYVSKGTVYVFDKTGSQKNSFQVGIIPGSFAFYYQDEK
jgi:YVTN family beta-propeller protein